MLGNSVLVWNGKADAVYKEARRQITAECNMAPKTVKELDFSDFFETNEHSLVYFPVFQGTRGWWGPLLGTAAKIRSKIIVSPECQLYEIGTDAAPAASKIGANQLFVAEFLPKTSFFKKIRESSASVKDMIATDSGMILALLSGKNESRVKNCVKTEGGEFFGHIGTY